MPQSHCLLFHSSFVLILTFPHFSQPFDRSAVGLAAPSSAGRWLLYGSWFLLGFMAIHIYSLMNRAGSISSFSCYGLYACVDVLVEDRVRKMSKSLCLE